MAAKPGEYDTVSARAFARAREASRTDVQANEKPEISVQSPKRAP